MQSRLITPPLLKPVSLEDAKAFLRVDGNEDDARIELMIDAATEAFEAHLSRKFITQTWVTYFEHFPRCYNKAPWFDGTLEIAVGEFFETSPTLELEFGGLQSVTSVGYTAEDGTFTLSPSFYAANLFSHPGRIQLNTNQSWPSNALSGPWPVAVQAVYGFGAEPSSVPAVIRQAIMLFVSKMYENRGDDTGDEFFGTSGFTIPSTALVLVQPWVRMRVI